MSNTIGGNKGPDFGMPDQPKTGKSKFEKDIEKKVDVVKQYINSKMSDESKSELVNKLKEGMKEIREKKAEMFKSSEDSVSDAKESDSEEMASKTKMSKSERKEKNKAEMEEWKKTYFDSEPVVIRGDGLKGDVILDDYDASEFKEVKTKEDIEEEIPEPPIRDPRRSEAPNKALPSLPNLPPNRDLPPLPNVMQKMPSIRKNAFGRPNDNAIRSPSTEIHPLSKRAGEINDFREKAKELGYRFDRNSNKYQPFQDESKKALTKDEMKSLIDNNTPFTYSKKTGPTIDNRDARESPSREPKIRTNKPAVDMGELKNSPLMAKKREEKEFEDKAESLGYSFNEDFGMYVSGDIALTKQEMQDLIDGKLQFQREVKQSEEKFEGRTDELDAFARDLYLKFNEESGMYISDNPFVVIKNATIDEMKEMMAKKEIDNIARSQGYSPIEGMDGIYQNEDGDIKAADEFR